MLSTRQTVQDTRPVYLTPKFEPQFRRDLMLAAALVFMSLGLIPSFGLISN